MRKRTQSRVVAIQALYQIEQGGMDIRNELHLFYLQQKLDDDVLEFAKLLVEGCNLKKDEIDEKLSSIAENWRLHRMAVIDKCILRLGVYELLYRSDIPEKVSINEAIDLAKTFSTENSGKFVNGILDKILTKYKT